ncbi:MFS transporter [Vibrio sinensis]|uniref:MFS transporter n=1 Tax=Vibrio sinensis TaxID=2302434 RepID=A0A3A6R4R4_9VIBR|nr:MFS transporter [Vibrio sinensis]RJX71952.1 MFS transporter [Vibrio sinensis]
MSTPQADSYVVVGRKEKFAYGLGDLASNLSFGFVSLFLLYFYTDIYGLTAAQASLIFVIARVVDAIFNLLVGYFIDKTQTKHGKLRPYLLYGSIPLGVLTVICFTAIDTDYKFAYALISYTLYCIAYTAVNTPYSAMTNMLTQHEGSRASLSVYRFTLAILGYLLVSTQAEVFVGMFVEPSDGYVFAASIFALLATFLFLACFGYTKERIEVVEVAQTPSLSSLISSVKLNMPLHFLSAYTTFVYITYTLWMAVAIYYINYVLNDSGFIGSFFFVQTAAYAAGTVIAGRLVDWIGKKRLALFTLPLGAGALAIQYTIDPSNLMLIMACVCVYSVALAINFVVMWSMVADTVEYSEWKTQVRAEGAIYGYFNFITKIAMAIGGGLAGWLLQYYGYSSETISAEAVNGINLMMTVIPAVLFIVSIVFIRFYQIDEHQYRDMIQQIQLKKLQLNSETA